MNVEVPLGALLVGTFFFGAAVGFIVCAILQAMGREVERKEKLESQTTN